ncbi:MAG: glycerate kinase [Fibrobacteres bacterium]|nr:glycerate kinase [Fibrobacterota bacterium]
MKTIRLIIAIDSFKESLTSAKAADAFIRGFKIGNSKATFKKLLISDGGEGFTEALVNNSSGKLFSVSTRDPLYRKTKASIGRLNSGAFVIETAAAAGLEILKPHERNPLKTTTFGLGILIQAAVNRGAKEIIVGLGGSATNDGGTGMLQALGVKFIDKKGNELATPMTGSSLELIHKIDFSELKKLSSIKFTAACDVKNPLYGKMGAAAIFSPQKGANPQMVKRLDAGLKNLAQAVKRSTPKSNPDRPGSGAAGGLGFAFAECLKASLVPGIDIMLKACDFDRHLSDSDLVITGEGRIDGQTGGNKAPYGIASAAAKKGVPVIAVCGSMAQEASALYKNGFSGIYSIIPKPMNLSEAMQNAETNMVTFAEAFSRTISSLRKG